METTPPISQPSRTYQRRIIRRICCEAQSLTFLKELKYDISFMTRRTLFNFDNNATNCYDHIIVALASLGFIGKLWQSMHPRFNKPDSISEPHQESPTNFTHIQSNFRYSEAVKGAAIHQAFGYSYPPQYAIYITWYHREPPSPPPMNPNKDLYGWICRQ